MTTTSEHLMKRNRKRTARASPAALPVLALALLLVPGCFGEKEEDGSRAGGPPGELPRPVWRAGDSWSYLSETEGWWNVTVQGLASHAGRPGYRVTIETSKAVGVTGAREGSGIVDAATLGWLVEDLGLRITSPCPRAPVFPMEDVVFECTMEAGGYQQPMRYHHRLGNWTQVEAPAGDFLAVEIWGDLESNQAFYRNFYSPEVGNRVRWIRQEGAVFELSAFSFLPGGPPSPAV